LYIVAYVVCRGEVGQRSREVSRRGLTKAVEAKKFHLTLVKYGVMWRSFVI